jgi:hypothetical protein
MDIVEDDMHSEGENIRNGISRDLNGRLEKGHTNCGKEGGNEANMAVGGQFRRRRTSCG